MRASSSAARLPCFAGVQFYRACERGDLDLVEDALEEEQAGAWLVQRRHRRTRATALWAACRWGHSETADALLCFGADPNLRARSCKQDW